MKSESPALVAVIGAGPGGIGAAMMLRKAGIDDVVIFERSDEVGGSWHVNDYPGIGVDVPAFTYQYSFAKNPNWSRLFPKGAEVLRYHQQVARDGGLYDHIRFGTNIVREKWDANTHMWVLTTTSGETFTARFVINAIGAYINPKADPGIAGYNTFAGKILRPVGWDHTYDLKNKRVGIVGTGASSVQITPAIGGECSKLVVFQRTPVWCLPKPDATFGPVLARLFRHPSAQSTVSTGALWLIEIATHALVYTPPVVAQPVIRLLDRAAQVAYRIYLRAVVDDEATRKALMPHYGALGKRPTLSNEFLQAFNRDEVELVSTAIESIDHTGINTADGSHYDLDALVLATGYELFSDPEAYRVGTVVGENGFDLAEFYNAQGLQAYQSVAVHGLPNRWTLIGPYSWTGTGWHFMVETAATHAIRAIREAERRRTTRVEVTLEAMNAYHQLIRRRGRNIDFYFRTLNKGIRTYYVNSHGDTPYIRPSTVLEAQRDANSYPLGDYTWQQLPTNSSPTTEKATRT
ncbi:flavin-containing monooxygenase [Rhodococcus erythropolis]|uniref:flavin-containing monooxygenase n=1 Tax=Rhodococcus erythropolis TaxID=1833 RepID=UPI0027E394AB|nr:NAD(P)/FAD-dependent oxidoreductase [Rhodococcus erythropolis]